MILPCNDSLAIVRLVDGKIDFVKGDGERAKGSTSKTYSSIDSFVSEQHVCQ